MIYAHTKIIKTTVIKAHNSYSHNMSLGGRVLKSKSFSGVNSVVVVWIDRLTLTPVFQSFKDVQLDQHTTKQQGLHLIPNEVINLLNTLQKVVFESWKGLRTKSPVPSHCFFNSDQQWNARIEEYLEFCYNVDQQMIGWRIFYVIIDPEFSFEVALKCLWVEEEKSKSNKKSAEIEWLSTRLSWIENGISAYMEEPSDEILDEAISLSIDDDSNPVSIRKNLTFDNSIRLMKKIHPNVADIFVDEESYFRDDDNDHHPLDSKKRSTTNGAMDDEAMEEEDEDGIHNAMAEESTNEAPKVVQKKCIAFPNGAYIVKHRDRRPIVFRMIPIFKEPLVEVDDILTRQKKRITICDIVSKKKSKKEPIIEGVARQWETMTQGLSLKQINELRYSKETEDLMNSITYDDEFCPGGQKTTEYYRLLIQKDKNWSAIDPPTGVMDGRMSWFANFVTTDLYALDVTSGISVLHTNVFFLLVLSLGTFDCHEEKLRIHPCYYGPPASGKSFGIECLEKISTPGLIHWISNQTKKANTTNSIHNGMMICMDELPEIFTDEGDGSGTGSIKEMLSKGTTKTEMCVIDNDTKERMLTYTVHERKTPHVSCTNLSMAQIPEAHANRFMKFYVPNQKNPNMDPIIESYFMKIDKSRTAKFDNLKGKWRTRQLISYLLWRDIAAGIIPNIDMSLALHVASIVFSYIEREHGIYVEDRDRERIMQFCSYIVMYDAINIVFFSGRVFNEEMPFDKRQIFKCIPYLTSNREHFFFSLGLLRDAVYHPSLLLILESMQKIIDNQELDSDKFAPLNGEQALDYNYYCISVHASVSTLDMVASVSNVVLSWIGQNTSYKLSASCVKDVIVWLTRQQKNVTLYSKDGLLSDSSRVVEVAKVRKSGFRYGLDISRQYLSEMIANQTCVVTEAIKFAMGGMKTKIVTGISERFDKTTDGVLFPFIYKTISPSDAKNKRRMYFKQPGFVRAGEDILFGVEKPANQSSSMFQSFETETLEAVFEAKWHEITGVDVSEIPEELQAALPQVGVYPETLKDAYKSEISKLDLDGDMDESDNVYVDKMEEANDGERDGYVHMEEEEEDDEFEMMDG